jgi:hypothetical protein
MMSIESKSAIDDGVPHAPVNGWLARLLKSCFAIACYTLGLAWIFRNRGVTASTESWAFAVVGGIIGFGVQWVSHVLTQALFTRSWPWRIVIYTAFLLLLGMLIIGVDRAVWHLKSM